MTEQIYVMFKIRSRRTGLYSKGGVWPTFSKAGKVWKRRGDIGSHFSQLDNKGRQIYSDHDIEIVELHVIEVETTPGNVWLDAARQRADEKKAAAEERTRRYREAIEREQLATLLKKYGAQQ